jgi:hypothetical protein
MEEVGDSTDEMVFPTIMLFESDDEEDFIGFIATSPKPDMVLAGPLVIKQDRPRPFAVLKLMSAYDTAMANMKISSYVFWTEADGRLHKAIERLLDMEPYASDGGRMFYMRKL